MAIEKWEKPTKWRFPLAIFDYDSGYHKLIFGKLSLSRFALAQCLDHLDSSCPHCQFRIVPNPILSPLAKVAGPLDTPYLSCIHSLSILLVTRHLSSIFSDTPDADLIGFRSNIFGCELPIIILTTYELVAELSMGLSPYIPLSYRLLRFIHHFGWSNNHFIGGWLYWLVSVYAVHKCVQNGLVHNPRIDQPVLLIG